MQNRILSPEQATSFVLAADARLTHTNYVNDQIWELEVSRGEPPALALNTTYGLRAKNQRIFPRFVEGDLEIYNMVDFLSPVIVTAYYPNYIELTFEPLEGIQATLIYWVPSSQAVACLVEFINTTSQRRNFRLEWVDLLSPTANGQRMVNEEIANVHVLCGKTEQLHPVFFISGGARHATGPYPALALDLELSPNQKVVLQGALASLSDRISSFELARSITSETLIAEIARVKMINASQIQILTGDPAWNQVLDITQTLAASLLMASTDHLPNLSFVLTRQPDRGYSLRGDGSDYNYLWNGQTPLNTLYLCQELLPQYPDIGRALIENFLADQNEDGGIDWKPGLGNQRTSLLATPILAHLAWWVYDKTLDIEFVRNIFPKLLRFYHYWFSSENDRDQDSVPEWSHPFQTGFENNPMFSIWMEDTQGVNISTVESPDLCSMLYMESQALIQMAGLLGEQEAIPFLQDKINLLYNALNISWDETANSYFYVDRDAHISQDEQTLVIQEKVGDFLVQQSFPKPVRVQIHLTRPGEATRRIGIFLYGTIASGSTRVERISTEQFQWHLENGYATSDKTYQYIEKIIVEGLHEQDQLTIRTVGHHQLDQTYFWSLAAKISQPKKATYLLRKTIMDPALFWLQSGIPSYPKQGKKPFGEIQLPFNTWAIRGMLQYNHRDEAAELVTRIMNTLVSQFEKDGCFRRTYAAENGQGLGEKNHLEGLAPVGIFLEVLGIHLINPWKVYILGKNPFPWPVTVKYCGMTVLSQKSKTTIIFPDGQTVSVTDDGPHLVSLE
jgi:hypothetical protein